MSLAVSATTEALTSWLDYQEPRLAPPPSFPATQSEISPLAGTTDTERIGETLSGALTLMRGATSLAGDAQAACAMANASAVALAPGQLSETAAVASALVQRALAAYQSLMSVAE